MKQTNSILSVPFKATCRKTILAAALFCGFSMMANFLTGKLLPAKYQVRI